MSGRIGAVTSGPHAAPRVDPWVRLLRHEYVLACAGGVALAVVMTWIAPPVALWLLTAGERWDGVANPVTTIAGDLGDPTLQAWQVAWTGHALLADPGNLWHTNAFFPERYALAFSDSLLGYAPAGLVGSGPAAAVLRYNVLFVLAFALAFVGLYALVRQLGAARVAAVVAAAAFAYAPWRYGHTGHLNVLSTGGIPLALAMLARGHGWSLRRGYRPELVRPGWAVAGWLVVAWQVSLGFGLGLPFGYVLGVGVLVLLVRRAVAGGAPVPAALWRADALGAAAALAVVAALVYPYTQVRAAFPDSVRSWEYVGVFSTPLRGLLVAPAESLVWRSWHGPARDALGSAVNEKALLCGYVLIGLAAVGLFRSVWPARARALLGVGVLVSALLALGTEGPLYRVLYDLAPGFDGIRTPGRLVLWTSLLLAVLAAGAVTALQERLAGERRPVAVLLLAPLTAAVLVEGLPLLGHPVVPPAPPALASAPAPLMVLPTDVLVDNRIQLWGTDTFPAMVNGGSGQFPPRQAELREAMRTFPDAAAVEALRRIGVRSVVVLREEVAGTDYAGALTGPTAGLGITRREVGRDVVYDLAG